MRDVLEHSCYYYCYQFSLCWRVVKRLQLKCSHTRCYTNMCNMCYINMCKQSKKFTFKSVCSICFIDKIYLASMGMTLLSIF